MLDDSTAPHILFSHQAILSNSKAKPASKATDFVRTKPLEHLIKEIQSLCFYCFSRPSNFSDAINNSWEMPTATLDHQGMTAFLGKASRQFYDFKSVMAQLGHSVVLVESVDHAKRLLETQKIATIVNNLNLDDEKTRLMINEFRKIRPQLKVVPGGSSLSQVIEDNYYALARDIDGTITVEQFRAAFKKIRGAQNSQERNVLWGVFGLAAVLSLAMFWPSPYVTFLGTFWFALLVVEFAYCTILLKTGPNED